MEIPAPILGKLQRLASHNIELVPFPGLMTHFVFARDGFASLVERTPHGFGQIGSAGLITERGFAALVWRDQQPWFVGRGFEHPATSEQVQSLRRFSADLRSALENS